jgi:hypothetical protein
MKTKNIYLISSILTTAIAITALFNTDKISYRYGPLGSVAAIVSTHLLAGAQALALGKILGRASRLKLQHSDIIDESVSIWRLADYKDRTQYLSDLYEVCGRKLLPEDLNEK